MAKGAIPAKKRIMLLSYLGPVCCDGHFQKFHGCHASQGFELTNLLRRGCRDTPVLASCAVLMIQASTIESSIP
jgi:hypothetical protein